MANEGTIFDLGVRGADSTTKALKTIQGALGSLKKQITNLKQAGGLADAMQAGKAAKEINSLTQAERQASQQTTILIKHQQAISKELQAQKKLQKDLREQIKAATDPKNYNNLLRQLRESVDITDRLNENMGELSALAESDISDIQIGGGSFGGGYDDIGLGGIGGAYGSSPLEATTRATSSLGQLGFAIESFSGETELAATEVLTSVGEVGEFIGAIAAVGEGFQPVIGVMQNARAAAEAANAARVATTGVTVTATAAETGLAGATGAAGASAATATGGFAGLATALLANTVALSSFIVIAGAAVAVLTALKFETDRARESYQRQLEAESENTERLIELARMRREMTSEQIEEERQALNEELGIRQDAVDQIEDNARTIDEIYADPPDWTPFTGGLDFLNDAIVRYSASMMDMDLQNAANDASDSLDNVTDSLEDLDTVAGDVAAREAAENVAEAEEALIDVRYNMAEAIERYGEQLQDLQDGWAFEDRRRLEDEQRADEQAEQAHQNRLLEIEEGAREQIEDVRSELISSIADTIEDYEEARLDAEEQLREDLAGLVEEGAERELEIRENLQEEEAEMVAEHQVAMLDAENDYMKERLRRLEDMQDELLNAEMQNDVVAFIQAQRQAEKDLRRMDEDHQEQQAETQRQFQEQRQERRQQAQEELRDLRESLAERREELQEAFKEEQADRAEEHAERLAEMREQADERISQIQEQAREELAEQRQAFQLQMAETQQERAFEAQRREEDRRMRLAEMEQSAQEELAVLSQREQAALQVIQSGGQMRLAEIERMEREMRAATVASYQDALSQIQAMSTQVVSRTGGRTRTITPTTGTYRGYTLGATGAASLRGLAGGSSARSITSAAASRTSLLSGNTRGRTGGYQDFTPAPIIRRRERPTVAGKGNVPGRQFGGSIGANIPVMVGEAGPELAIIGARGAELGQFRRPADILPDAMGAMSNYASHQMQGNSGGYSFDFSGMTIGGDGVSRGFVEAQMQQLAMTVVQGIQTAVQGRN